jgi:hypothetical protein
VSSLELRAGAMHHGPSFPWALAAKHQLEYYATQFETVELNGVFYRTPPTSATGYAPSSSQAPARSKACSATSRASLRNSRLRAEARSSEREMIWADAGAASTAVTSRLPRGGPPYPTRAVVSRRRRIARRLRGRRVQSRLHRDHRQGPPVRTAAAPLSCGQSL